MRVGGLRNKVLILYWVRINILEMSDRPGRRDPAAQKNDPERADRITEAKSAEHRLTKRDYDEITD